MKKYLNHIRSKPPHERRQHAVQIAGVCTAIVFVAWITTLGVRLANYGGTVTQSDSGADQTAGAFNAYQQSGNSLEVATTTADSGQGVTLPYAQ